MEKSLHPWADYNVVHADGQSPSPEKGGAESVSKHYLKARLVSRIALTCLFIGWVIYSGRLLLVSPRTESSSISSHQDDGDIPCVNIENATPCDNLQGGYKTQSNNVSQLWGQYSPYFPTGSSDALIAPLGFQITFVQYLSRHGARYPTPKDSGPYHTTIATLKSRVKPSGFKGPYAFLAAYNYTLGDDGLPGTLTDFGRKELVDAATQFYAHYTSVNHTLDSNAQTFPPRRKIYADFMHEDPMLSISSAMGLFDQTFLNPGKFTLVDSTIGFSAARVVPFAARFTVEKMTCQQNEMVRVIVNGRVMPLYKLHSECEVNTEGLCALEDFLGVLESASHEQGKIWKKSCK